MKKFRPFAKSGNLRAMKAESTAVFIVLFASLLAFTTASWAATVVVNPSNMDGWAFYITSLDGVGEMVLGPSTPPLGLGSARLFTGTHGDERVELQNTNYSGTLLSSLTALSFSTYATSWNGQQVPYLRLNIDWNNDGLDDDGIFFEPPYQTPASGNPLLPNQGDAVLNTWQTWNALVGGWWSNNWAGMTPGIGVQSLATYIAAFPNARIVNYANGAPLDGVRLIYGWASSWDVFNGYVDDVTINSTTYDFEPATPVHNITQGTNYVTIEAAVAAAASGNIIEVDPGTYPEGIITIGVNLTLRASNTANPPTITPTTDTGGSGDGRGWFLVNEGITANFDHLIFNGLGKEINIGILSHGPGSVTNCIFEYIRYDYTGGSGHCYCGRAIAHYGDYAFTVENCTVSDFGRIALYFYGPTTIPVVCRGNVITGKGVGDWLDYGVELEGGAVATVENNVITDCKGIAYGTWGSAAVLATTYFASGTQGTFHGNILTNNAVGFYIGYDTSDLTVATITRNKMEDNDYGVDNESSTLTVEATANWWGATTGPSPVTFLSVTHPASPTGDDGSVPMPGGNNLDDGSYGTVHYSPWVASSGDDHESGTPGWQPDLSIVGVSTNGTIQEGINMVTGSTVNVLPGTYTAPVNVNQVVTLNGSGSGSNPATNTIIAPTSGSGIVISVSGASAVNRVVIQNLRCTGAPGNGIDITAANATYLTFNNVASVSNTGNGINTNPPTGSPSCADWIITGCNLSSNVTGLRFPSYAACNGLTITGGSMDGNVYGFQSYSAVGSPLLTNVNVTGTTFNNNTSKGMYLENLDHATFTGITVNNSGTAGAWAAGVDINLKYHSFFDIFFVNPIITNSGTGDAVNGAGMTIKARDDGSDYGAHPATLNNVQITGGTFSGNREAIRFGEPTKNNAGPTAVQVHTCSLTGSVLKELRNETVAQTNATCNWWGSLNYATILGKTSGLVDFDPWNDATLANCTYTDLNTTDFTLSFDDPYVSCGVSPCQTAILKIAFDRANFVSGTLVITLPTNIIADWTGDQYQIMPPAGDCSTNLSFMNAAGGGTSTITLDVSWDPPYSTGAPNQYIAWLPVRSNSASNGTYLVTYASYDYWDMNQVQYDGTPNAFDFSLPNIYVDCIAPDVTLSGGAGEGSCAGYNDAVAFENALSMTFTNTGAPASTPLTAQIVMTRPDLSTVTYAITPSNGTWPPASVWDAMILQGCYIFTLTATDATCNTSAPASVTVIKDTQAPVFNPTAYFTQGSPCYNNITGDPNNGATRLDAELNMNVDAPDTCETDGFTLMFTMGANSLTPISGAAISGYPDSTQAAALWIFIVANTVPNYSGNDTVNWSLKDCLGNETTGSFVFCVDFALPDNTFTVFDARPTYGGIWLHWAWTYDATEATAAEVWRKGEGDYPVYAGNLSMNDTNYVKVHANLVANGWTPVAAQSGPNNTAALYTGGNNTHHTDPTLGTYWKDSTGTDDVATRSIYRYVTFVRDAAGNWSSVGSYTIGDDADRSTNYWLGDYGPLHGPDAYTGYVHGPDLTLLSEHYFTTVNLSWDYLDIGPENHENAVGKGIPNPDQVINFQDLLPFSFNFGVVTPTGFNIHFPNTKPFSGLDEQPVVSVSRGEDVQLSVGDNFTVTVALSGNAGHSVKVVEAELHFDPQVIKLVSATEGAIEVMDGIPFALARPIEGRENAVGIAAAAMGEIACIAGDFALATMEFQWIREQTSTTEIELTSIQLADGHGNIVEGTGTTLTINGADAVPLEFALYQNYPNPFNPSTQIRFDLADASEVRLVIFNLLGQKVRTLVAANMPAGAHQIAWDGRDDSGLDVSTGLYLYKLQAASFVSCRKMLLTR